MSDKRAIQFVREQIYGWVGNLMRDLEAQGTAVSLVDVAVALEQVAYDIGEEPSVEEYEDFLRDLNDGRGTE